MCYNVYYVVEIHIDKHMISYIIATLLYEYSLEAFDYRRLQSPHVVTFYGSMLKKDDHGVYPVLVMEYLDQNLYEVIRAKYHDI